MMRTDPMATVDLLGVPLDLARELIARPGLQWNAWTDHARGVEVWELVAVDRERLAEPEFQKSLKAIDEASFAASLDEEASRQLTAPELAPVEVDGREVGTAILEPRWPPWAWFAIGGIVSLACQLIAL